MWGVPEICGKIPEKFYHCNNLIDISRQACLAYVDQKQVKVRILAPPLPNTCCYGNPGVVNAGQIYFQIKDKY